MSDTTARKQLLTEYERLDSWRAVSRLPQYKGIPPGTLCSFAKGDYIPKSNEYRRKLGLPEIIQQEVTRDKKGRFS